MDRARRHQRLLALSALALLALVAELVGRSLTHRFNVGQHVASPSYAGADYYPFLLAGIKGAIALLLARVTWRFTRAHATARAAARALAAVGAKPTAAPRMRLELSPRLWALTFATTSAIYLVQADAEGLTVGRHALLYPWLHTSALPVFAVLSVVVALLYGVVARWLADYERYAQSAAARVAQLDAAADPPARNVANSGLAPRRLFGLSFESRPPPLPA
jgi:hypothetical protein